MKKKLKYLTPGKLQELKADAKKVEQACNTPIPTSNCVSVHWAVLLALLDEIEELRK